jgi:hypothetical protein
MLPVFSSKSLDQSVHAINRWSIEKCKELLVTAGRLNFLDLANDVGSGDRSFNMNIF